jgi:hypothetical protein
MVEYYIAVGSERRGPFSIAQLQAQGLRPEALVWRAGLANWTPAIEVSELKTGVLATVDVNPYTPTRTATPVFAAAHEMKHSRFGIAAFILGLLIAFGEFALIIVAGIMEITTPGGVDEQSLQVMLLGLVMLAGMLGALVGAVLAIIGLTERNRYKAYPVLGLGINGLILLGVVALMVIGTVMS